MNTTASAYRAHINRSNSAGVKPLTNKKFLAVLWNIFKTSFK